MINFLSSLFLLLLHTYLPFILFSLHISRRSSLSSHFSYHLWKRSKILCMLKLRFCWHVKQNASQRQNESYFGRQLQVSMKEQREVTVLNKKAFNDDQLCYHISVLGICQQNRNVKILKDKNDKMSFYFTLKFRFSFFGVCACMCKVCKARERERESKAKPIRFCWQSLLFTIYNRYKKAWSTKSS